MKLPSARRMSFDTRQEHCNIVTYARPEGIPLAYQRALLVGSDRLRR